MVVADIVRAGWAAQQQLNPNMSARRLRINVIRGSISAFNSIIATPFPLTAFQFCLPAKSNPLESILNFSICRLMEVQNVRYQASGMLSHDLGLFSRWQQWHLWFLGEDKLPGLRNCRCQCCGIIFFNSTEFIHILKKTHHQFRSPRS